MILHVPPQCPRCRSTELRARKGFAPVPAKANMVFRGERWAKMIVHHKYCAKCGQAVDVRAFHKE